MTDSISDSPHNFSRVSDRDELAFGSARPGSPNKQVSEAEVSEWVTFMKSKGVQSVLSLLGDDEKEEYYPGLDVDAIMRSSFGEKNYTRTSVFAPDALDKMSDALARARESEQKIVMHCSGGTGRASLALMLWLVDTYGILPEDAAREVEAEVERCKMCNHVVRRVSSPKLVHLITNGTMTGYSE